MDQRNGRGYQHGHALSLTYWPLVILAKMDGNGYAYMDSTKFLMQSGYIFGHPTNRTLATKRRTNKNVNITVCVTRPETRQLPLFTPEFVLPPVMKHWLDAFVTSKYSVAPVLRKCIKQ